MSKSADVVLLAPAMPKGTPAARLIGAVQAAYETMPEADQKECVNVFLDMITAGVKAAREGRNEL